MFICISFVYVTLLNKKSMYINWPFVMWRQSIKSVDDIPPTLIKKWLPDTFFSLCQISISSHILNFPLSYHTVLYCTILYYICLLSDILPSYTFNSFLFPPLFRLSLPSRMTSRHTYRTETQNLPEYSKTLSVVIQRQSLSSLCLHQGVSSEIDTKERYILCGHLITWTVGEKEKKWNVYEGRISDRR